GTAAAPRTDAGHAFAPTGRRRGSGLAGRYIHGAAAITSASAAPVGSLRTIAAALGAVTTTFGAIAAALGAVAAALGAVRSAWPIASITGAIACTITGAIACTVAGAIACSISS